MIEIIMIILVFVLAILSYILGWVYIYTYVKGQMFSLLKVKKILDNHRKKNGVKK